MKYYELWEVWYGTHLGGSPTSTGELICRKTHGTSTENAVDLFVGGGMTIAPFKDKGRTVYVVNGRHIIANLLTNYRLKDLKEWYDI